MAVNKYVTSSNTILEASLKFIGISFVMIILPDKRQFIADLFRLDADTVNTEATSADGNPAYELILLVRVPFSASNRAAFELIL